MGALNRVVILGNLGADPELRQTANGLSVTSMSVATKDVSTGDDGQKKEFVEWHKVNIWGKMAENACKFLKKGSSVLVEGRLKTRSYDDKDGIKRYVTEIVAQNVQFIGGGSGATRSENVPPPSDDDGPF